MNDFFNRHYLTDDYYRLDTISADFFDDMTRGLNGDDQASLLMLPSFAMVDSDIMLNKKITVVDAGGTNIRFAHVWFDDKGVYHADRFKRRDMFGVDEALTKDAFFDALADEVLPYLDETDAVAISFAYPTTITEDMDGQIIRLVKEIKISGTEGCLIGKELKAKLLAKGRSDIRVFVTNDTIATAFAGKAETIGQNFASHIGVIVGTGMNTCYPEKLDNIGKLPNYTGANRMMINTESGGFDQILRSKVDISFDASTIDTGYHALEKMVSGAYIGGLCGAYMHAACDEGLLSASAAETLKSMNLDTRDVSDFLSDNSESKLHHSAVTAEDKAKMTQIFEKVIRRAANLTALQIYCLALKCSDSGSQVCVTVEGTTFYKLPGLRSQTIEFLNFYLTKADITYKMMNVDDAVMKGCAAIGLQQ